MKPAIVHSLLLLLLLCLFYYFLFPPFLSLLPLIHFPPFLPGFHPPPSLYSSYRSGPEPPTDIVFSKVTENSLTVSWTKPKTPISGFKVTYTHTEDGENWHVLLKRIITFNKGLYIQKYNATPLFSISGTSECIVVFMPQLLTKRKKWRQCSNHPFLKFVCYQLFQWRLLFGDAALSTNMVAMVTHSLTHLDIQTTANQLETSSDVWPSEASSL